MRNSNVDNGLTRRVIKTVTYTYIHWTRISFHLQTSQIFPVWFQCGLWHPRIDIYNVSIIIIIIIIINCNRAVTRWQWLFHM